MLHLRSRGEVYYVRGTVRVGAEVQEVPEHSTGCRSLADAEAAASNLEAKIRKSILDGAAGRPASLTLTIADCILKYGNRSQGVAPMDAAILEDFAVRYGHRPLREAPAAWQEWLDQCSGGLSPGRIARRRNAVMAALRYAAGDAVPKVPTVRVPTGTMTAVPYLVPEERDRLLAAYNRWAQPAVITLAYQGCRTQEALQLDWRNVSWPRRTLYFSRTKNTRPRTVPMHRRVRVTLYLIWRRQGRPKSGPVFLSHHGAPYTDTRGVGGNPLRKAHETACRTAGVVGFRLHDWRHHYAAHMIMSGCDLITLMKLGGWQTMSMVARYAAVSTDHMAEAVARLA